MRFQKSIKPDNFSMMVEVIEFLEYSQVNEMSDETFQKFQMAGEKFGFKIRKVDSFFTYLKKASKGINDLVRYAGIYLSTDIKDNKTRKEMIKLAKDTLKRIDKHEVADFLLQFDKNVTHVSSILRHFFQSVLGINITTYHSWKEDIEYLKVKISDMKEVLEKMGAKNQLNILKKFEMSLKELEVK